MRHSIAALLILAAPLCSHAAELPAGTIQVTHVTWTAAPPSLPKGSQVAVLEGDPKAAGIFTMRVRVPAGSRLLPHWHPRPERVTVLSGQVRVGFGDTFTTSGRNFGAGSFYVNPPLAHHYVYFPRTSELQITGEGPWELHPVP
jgi:hypothetical protein